MIGFARIDSLKHCSRTRKHETQRNGQRFHKAVTWHKPLLLLQRPEMRLKFFNSKTNWDKNNRYSELKNAFNLLVKSVATQCFTHFIDLNTQIHSEEWYLKFKIFNMSLPILGNNKITGKQDFSKFLLALHDATATMMGHRVSLVLPRTFTAFKKILKISNGKCVWISAVAKCHTKIASKPRKLSDPKSTSEN